MDQQRKPSNKEFPFTMRDFDWLRGVASQHTGIVLSEDKYDMLYTRLSRRIRSLKLDSFASYCQYLNANKNSEVLELVNAVTTNLTSFFREKHHFEYLRGELIPVLLRRNRDSRCIRIWSAGCSTGEEPYSIAITLAEAIPEISTWDVKILATDIDSNVLEKARTGVYDAQRTQTLCVSKLSRWFRRGKDSNTGMTRVNEELRSLIYFKQLNLLDEWPVKGPFDAVFCRNVIIYFDRETKKAIVERFARLMHDESRLFLGHSESLFRITECFESLGTTIYKKAV